MPEFRIESRGLSSLHFLGTVKRPLIVRARYGSRSVTPAKCPNNGTLGPLDESTQVDPVCVIQR